MQAIAPYYITLFFMPPPDLWPPEGGTDMQVRIVNCVFDLEDVTILNVTSINNLQTTAAPEEEEGTGFGGIGRIMQVGCEAAAVSGDLGGDGDWI